MPLRNERRPTNELFLRQAPQKQPHRVIWKKKGPERLLRGRTRRRGGDESSLGATAGDTCWGGDTGRSGAALKATDARAIRLGSGLISTPASATTRAAATTTATPAACALYDCIRKRAWALLVSLAASVDSTAGREWNIRVYYLVFALVLVFALRTANSCNKSVTVRARQRGSESWTLHRWR